MANVVWKQHLLRKNNSLVDKVTSSVTIHSSVEKSTKCSLKICRVNLFRWTSGEVSRLSTYAGEFDPRTEYHLFSVIKVSCMDAYTIRVKAAGD